MGSRDHAVGAVVLVGLWFAAAPSFAQPEGAALFARNCSACHLVTGKGVPGAFPSLIGDKLANGPEVDAATRVLKGKGGMPAFRAYLSNAQVAAILTYVRSSWGNHAPPVTEGVVAGVRGDAAPNAPQAAVQAH